MNAVSAKSGGGITYALEQLAALARVPGMSLTVVASDPFASVLAERAPAATVEVVRRRPVVARFLWEQTVLARKARHFDVVYGIGNFALLLARRAQVVTFQNPNHFGRAGRDVYRRFSSRPHRARMAIEARLARCSVRRADEAVAISMYLRDMIVEVLPASQPRLIPSAPPDRDLAPRDGAGPPTRRPTPPRYVLSVANDYPHKDWDGLVGAFLTGEDMPPLVLVGAPRSEARAEELRATVAAAHEPRVVVWGAESDRREVDALYRGAEAYVAHSHLEAFALTPFEALARGVRLVASDIPSHREVCGDRAEYYDPERRESLVSAVRRALARPRPEPWRPERTWDDVARELAEAIESAASRHRVS